MRYLPYSQEKSRWETIYPNWLVGEYIEPTAWDIDWSSLPMTYALWNRFFENIDNWNYLWAGWDLSLLLPALSADAAWNFFSMPVNWYKRLYNNAAAVYNNIAAYHNSLPKTQTSLTGRALQTPVRWYVRTVKEYVPYLWEWVERVTLEPITATTNAAEIIANNNAALWRWTEVIPSWASKNIAAIWQAAANNASALAKTKIVNALWKMANSWSLSWKNWLSKAKTLIDLYKKIK